MIILSKSVKRCDMPFEIFSRKIVRRGTPAATATKLGRMAVNKTATAFLEKNAVEFVLLMWDADLRKIGIRPITKKDTRSYRVTYGEKGNGAGFSAKTFFDYIGLDYTVSRTMPASWNSEQEILELDVPEEFLKSSAQQKLLEIGPIPQRRAVLK
jgi:hypothetical protein